MSALQAIWWRDRPGLLARILLAPLGVLALAFRLVVAVRAWLYASGRIPAFRAAAPVVSIGNVAVGGAGKTPVAIAVAARLRARGRRIAVLSRGYGATRRDPRVVSDGARVLLGAGEGGDEPVLVARRLPGVAVLCGPRRAQLAPLATRQLGADVLVLDDGFQHRALARDLDVVVLDAANPFGNGRLLPCGPNREPRSALRRAGLVWLSRVDQAPAAAVEALRALARDATGLDPVESRHAPVDVVDGALQRSFGLAALRGRRVILAAGIARPDGFRRTVAALGAQIVGERWFPDHHRFTDAELAATLELAGPAERGGALVVLTEKDAVRLGPGWAREPRLRVLRIEAEILRGAETLDAALDRLLSAARPGEAAAPETSTPTPRPRPTAAGETRSP